MKELYVTDLDGTLLDSESRITPESAEMLNRAIEAGADFTIATARTPATVSSIIKDLRLRLPLVVMTGAAIWDPASDRYLHVCFHSEEDVKELIRVYRRHSLSTFIYTLRDHKIHIYHIGPLSEAERTFIDERHDNPYKTFHIPEDGESRLPDHLDNVVLMFALQPVGKAGTAYPDIKKVGKVNSVFYPDLFNPEIAFIEAFPEEATKAKGIARLRKMIGAERVVAFGDNVNDIPMLREADEGIAVENAVGGLKREADKIIGANTSDSVAREILNRVTPSAQP